MITLTNGLPQGPDSLIVPNGSIGFQLNVDAAVIAAPGGYVSASIEVVFQFDSTGHIQPNAPALAAQIYSNKELNPQNSVGLGTYYLVTFYDANGARINKNPMWWQFPESIGATVDISQIIPISTVGGNVIFYPTAFGGGGTVTSVAFVGDGTVLSSTPSTPVTTAGNISASLLNQSANTILAGPTSGPAAHPTFRLLTAADISALIAWNGLQNATGDLTLANTTFNTTFNQTSAVNWKWLNITAATNGVNQSSPILNLGGTYWNGAASAANTWTLQDIDGGGTNPVRHLTLTGTGSSGGQDFHVVSTGVTLDGAVTLGNNLIMPNGLIQIALLNTPCIKFLGNTPASGVANVNSGQMFLQGEYWDGAASQHDIWIFGVVEGAGANPTSDFKLSHTPGTTGKISFVLVDPTASTGVSLGVPSPQLKLSGTVWNNGTTSILDSWAIVTSTSYSVPTNSTSNLVIKHLTGAAGPQTGVIIDPASVAGFQANVNCQFGPSAISTLSTFSNQLAGTVNNTITSVANASAGTTAYTLTISPGGTYQQFDWVTITGFTNGANNGRFQVFSCTITTLTLYNPSGVAETHAATATLDSDYYTGTAVWQLGRAGLGSYPIAGVSTAVLQNIVSLNSGNPVLVFGLDANATDSAYHRLLNNQATTGNHGYEFGAIVDGTGVAPVAIQVGVFNGFTGWTLAQLQAATGGANRSSNSAVIQSAYWTGAASALNSWSIQDVLGAGANPTTTLTITPAGSSGVKLVNVLAPLSATTLTATAATPTGTGSNLGLGTTVGFGTGAAGTAVTTTTLGGGTGPTTPQTVVNYLEIDRGGTKFWIPLVQ